MENLDTLKQLANELPEAVRQQAINLVEEMGSTVEGIGDEPVTWKPPFLRLVQGTTDRGSIPKDARIGDFVIGESKIEAPFKIIPIRIWNARQYWDPDQTSNKMLCWSPDAILGQIGRECKGCPHAEWKDDGGSDCGKIKGVLAIAADFSTVFSINLGKSNFKVGNELESLMKRASVPPYARVYGLSSATNPTAKAVENFKIEVLDEKARRTPDMYIPFLKELFDRVSTDRRAMLDSFHSGIRKKMEVIALENSNSPQMALENSVKAGDSTTVTDIKVPEAAPETKQASTAMKYKV